MFRKEVSYLLATILALGAGCGAPELVELPRGAVELQVAMPSHAVGEVDVRCVIEAADAEFVLAHALDRNADGYGGIFNGIPAGADRRFTAQAFDADGELLQQVSARSAVLEGARVSVTLALDWPEAQDDAEVQDEIEAPQVELQALHAPRPLLETTAGDSVSLPTLDGPARREPGPISGLFLPNTAPAVTWTYQSVAIVAAGGEVKFELTASDIDEDPLTFVWSDDCSGNGFDPDDTNDVTWTAPVAAVAVCNVQCVVSDGQGGEDTAEFTVEVQAPVVPTISDVSPAGAIAGDTVTITGTGFLSQPAWNSVWFGSTEATPATVTATEITVLVPAGLPGADLDLTVETVGGTSGVAGFTGLSNRIYATADDGVYALDRINRTVEDSLALGYDGGKIALCVDGRRLFVQRFFGGEIKVIDTTDLSVIASVSVGTYPSCMLPGANETVLFVTNFGSNTVSVIDAAEGSPTQYQVIRTIAVGAGPLNAYLTPDGERVVVLNMMDHTISEIDFDSQSPTYLQVLATVELPGGYPGNLVWDGSTALVANQIVTDGLSMVDFDPASPTYRQVLLSATMSGAAKHLVNVPGTDRVYVGAYDANEDASYLGRFDLDQNALADTHIAMHQGGYPVAYSAATDELLLSSGPSWDDASAGGEIFFVQMDPGAGDFEEITGIVSLSDYPEAAALIIETGTLVVAGGEANAIHFVDVATKQVEASLPVGEYPAELAISPVSLSL